ncbi:PH domain-containing protein [Enterococcus faecium]|uniref:PH domain-containing protein n=1 Tax=Enterococcus faecium TaxID=1352 RepID=UPI0011059371|nr:PH domain-containing protein [Enterococcus faecium]MDB7484780.1 PH domain-containing protein [Enterococcus faecium]MDB7489826.1 PH domain-containing protein [Enterococcus faecium]MDB7492396.1 PH domain-containing protein [Enterococcus faecium]MDB7495032.1 PH domain-containing protein [Enterococcus faecium]MDB7497492.1 PH domain-containing protein [Enterococcus faecium]
MNEKQLRNKIQNEANVGIYTGLLKTVAPNITENDCIVSAFDCQHNTTKGSDLALVVATDTKIIIATDRFFKKNDLQIINKSQITDMYVEDSLFKKHLIIRTTNRTFKVVKIKQSKQLANLISAF